MISNKNVNAFESQQANTVEWINKELVNLHTLYKHQAEVSPD